MTPQDVGVAICQKSGYVFGGSAGEGAFKHTFLVKIGDVSRALKLFKEPPTERSHREIEAMTRCDHPNVAKLLAVRTIRIASTTFYYQLEEYLPGGTLNGRIGMVDAPTI